MQLTNLIFPVFFLTLWIAQLVGVAHAQAGQPGVDNFSYRTTADIDALPDQPFLNEKEEEITLASFKGQKVILNFWATWCGPCVAEMPAMDRLQQTLAEDNVIFVPVSQDFKGLKRVHEFYEREKIVHMGKYADIKNRLLNAFSTEGGLPVTIVIDSTGKIDSVVKGFIHWDNPEVATYLRALP